MTAPALRRDRRANGSATPDELAPVTPLFSRPDAEDAVLGAMLMEREAVETAKKLLTDSSFEAVSNRRLYRAMLEVFEAGSAVDPITVQARLLDNGDLETAGGTDRLAYLQDAVPTAANIEYHAKIVREAAWRRRTKDLGEQLIREVAKPGITPGEIVEWQRRALDDNEQKFGIYGDRSRFAFRSVKEVEALPPVEFLIDEIIPSRSLAEMHGAPGSGKSFIALDMTLCIATGRPFHTHPVKRAGAIYVAAEGSAGSGQRVSAWRESQSIQELAGVHFVTQPLNLLDATEVGQFIAEARLAIGGPIGMVTLDTFARCFIGGDENSAGDVGVAIAAADRIRTALGCTVLIIHHSRKDSDVERGSTALRGAVDVMLSVRLENERLITISCEKQKDAPPFPTMDLQLEPTLDSCVISARNALHNLTDKLTTQESVALIALQTAFLEDGATGAQWQEAANIPKRTFFYVRSRLVRGGYVHEIKSGNSKRYIVASASPSSECKSAKGVQSSAMHTSAKSASNPPPLKGGMQLQLQEPVTLSREEEEAYFRSLEGRRNADNMSQNVPFGEAESQRESQRGARR